MEKIIETESQEIYKSKNKKEQNEAIKNISLIAEHKGHKFPLFKFKTIKEKGEVVFAYKIYLLSNYQYMLYYKPLEDNKDYDYFIKEMKEQGLETINMRGVFDNTLSQKHIIENN